MESSQIIEIALRKAKALNELRRSLKTRCNRKAPLERPLAKIEMKNRLAMSDLGFPIAIDHRQLIKIS